MKLVNLEKVICPICRGMIMQLDDIQIHCLNCRQTYPIIDSVPNFLPRELMEKYNQDLKHQDLFEEHAFYENLYKNLNGLDDGHCVVYGYKEIYDFMKDIPRGTLLDIGCGAGHHCKDLSERGFDVTGIDISLNGIRQAIAIADAYKQNTRFFLGDIENLPFEDQSFDIVFCGLIIHHFPKRDKLLSEIQRVTKKNFITFEVNSYDPISFIRFNIINPTIGIKNITKNQRTVSPFKLKKDLEIHGFVDPQIKFVDIHHNIGRYPNSISAKILKTYNKFMALMPEKYKNNKFILKCTKQFGE